ncbi:MAG: AAA family ATPase [Beijerinckiaceae bacterium]
MPRALSAVYKHIDNTCVRQMTEAPEPEKPARHGLPWNEEEERWLYAAFVAGESEAALAAAHARTPGGIRSHLKKLGLLDEDGKVIEPRPDYAPTAAAQKRAEKAVARAAMKISRKPQEEETAAEINPRFGEALRLMTDTDQSLFITGKAGTGKSTLLRHFRRHTKKNLVVLAPTGIAALNVGGQTIHHFFRFTIDVTPQKVASRRKIRNPKLYKKIDAIVIDEISMVRADVLDCVEAFLRLHGPHPGQSFGGVQMIFIGDLYQLPPVVGSQDRAIFSEYYETPYFFSAHALRDFSFPVIELEKVYRQKDRAFVALLNRVRNDTVTADDIALLNSRYGPASALEDARFSITLTATNLRADDINGAHLAALRGKTYHATADVQGDFGRDYFPAAPELSFKPGAQIMLLNNDRDGRWVNGSIGVIASVQEDESGREFVSVNLQDRDEAVKVYPHKWEVYHFVLADNQIQSEPVGTFEQYPFRLAWAVTIHKSQGKTFERVTIDIGAGAFAGGQVYVALSRCTAFEGITLKTPIKRQHIHIDPRIHGFMERCIERCAAETTPPQSGNGTIALIERAIRDCARIDIVYLKGDGEKTMRSVYPRTLGQEIFKDKEFLGMKAFCLTSKEERLFSVERILEIKPDT